MCLPAVFQGCRFLGYVMTLNAGLVDWLHRAIKSQIPYAPKLVLLCPDSCGL